MAPIFYHARHFYWVVLILLLLLLLACVKLYSAARYAMAPIFYHARHFYWVIPILLLLLAYVAFFGSISKSFELVGGDRFATKIMVPCWGFIKRNWTQWWNNTPEARLIAHKSRLEIEIHRLEVQRRSLASDERRLRAELEMSLITTPPVERPSSRLLYNNFQQRLAREWDQVSQQLKANEQSLNSLRLIHTELSTAINQDLAMSTMKSSAVDMGKLKARHKAHKDKTMEKMRVQKTENEHDAPELTLFDGVPREADEVLNEMWQNVHWPRPAVKRKRPSESC